MVFRLLDDDFTFPDTRLAEEDGLLAIGGDLQPGRLLAAYQVGIFPWFNEGDPILWYSPHQRCVIHPGRIKISKSMRQLLAKPIFEITINKAFAAVIGQCAQTPRAHQDGTWITSDMQKAYIALHKMGVAQSIEVWQNHQLVGGLYGLKMGRVFCGESMFSHVGNASKTALIYLCQHLGYALIDCQLPNEHLLSMGAEMMEREVFMEYLEP